MNNLNRILQNDPLVKLIQKANFVGWIYALDYDTGLVMTNDLWKAKVQGIPMNCFLIAATFDPETYSHVLPADQEVLLLRVVRAARLPQHDDMIQTKIDNFQQQTAIFVDSDRDYDDITRNIMQFSGLECRVLGTFYKRENDLWLGSDLESFSSASRFNVYRPRGDALSAIANYVDPIRRQSALQQAAELGLENPPAPFQIGTVRYTSTERLHRSEEETKVPVRIQPSDFLARRTAVLGMTRTGKSNMVKQMVSVVKRVADESNTKIGQIIYDINGEYANANQQDKGAIADIYPNDTKRYRMLEAPGFRELRTNFYEQLEEGFAILQRELEESGRATSDYIRAFLSMSLDEPPAAERGEHNRWQVRVAAYKVLLNRAGFLSPQTHLIRFPAKQSIRDEVSQQAGVTLPDPATGLSLQQAFDWFDAARTVNLVSPLKSSSGKDWVDDTLGNLLNMIVQKGNTGSFISGYNILKPMLKYHSPTRTQDVADEIYDLLADGRIVILDLSVGDPTIREKVSRQIAAKIFNKSMGVFVEGETPPNIVVYIEEAHNLIGKGMDLTDTWPRLAKEGAKYRIALVYATQEVSSVHPNILANTENWFITHLNNTNEIRELAKFYDFDDFSRSLLRAQDVGFARVKTLSSPFVIPTQIDRFDPEAEKIRVAQVAQNNQSLGQVGLFAQGAR